MKNNKGFTLIELLIVIAILCILLALGTAFYSANKNDVKTQKATQEQVPVETQEQEPIQNEAVENAKKDWGKTL